MVDLAVYVEQSKMKFMLRLVSLLLLIAVISVIGLNMAIYPICGSFVGHVMQDMMRKEESTL